jgi:nitrogen PTS system EIIA component
MDLKVDDLVKLLEVSDKQIIKWIKEKNLPSYKINNEYKFNKAEINDWILKNHIYVSNKILDLNLTNKPVVITELIKKGGIHYQIEGKNVKDIIKNSINSINTPPDLLKETIISSILEREQMMPTAFGHGIAFPHSRNPIITDVEYECISVCFLNQGIDFNSIDGDPVHTLFILLSANSKRHLEILSKLAFLCQQNAFLLLLRTKAQKSEIIKFIENIEIEWSKRK